MTAWNHVSSESLLTAIAMVRRSRSAADVLEDLALGTTS